MATILLILQIFIIFVLVAIILLQKSGSDGLSGLSGGGHNFMSTKSSQDTFSKVTMILGIIFIANSLILGRIAINEHKAAHNLVESITDDQVITPINEAPIAE